MGPALARPSPEPRNSVSGSSTAGHASSGAGPSTGASGAYGSPNASATSSGAAGSIGATSSAARGAAAAPAGVNSAPSLSSAPKSSTLASLPNATGSSASNAVISLPASLVPVQERGYEPLTVTSKSPLDSTGSVTSQTFDALPYRPGTPFEVVFACRNAIIAAALPDGAISIDTASAGKAAKTRGGGLAAPISARIVYFLGGELRRAKLPSRAG